MFFFKRKRRKFNARNLSQAEKAKLARALRKEGGSKFSDEKFEDAVLAFQDLILLEPESPEHRRKLADCYARLEEKEKEIDARSSAAALYAEQGFLLKAIAMLKMVLAVDPSHQETQEKLNETKRRAGKPVGPIYSPPPLASDEEEKVSVVEAAQARIQAALKAREQLRSVRRMKVAPRIPASAPKSVPPDSVPPSSITPLSGSDVIFLDLGDTKETSTSDTKLDLEAALRQTPLFDDLDERLFEKLIDCVEIVELASGEILFRQGDPADSMYAIAEGEVQASAGVPEIVLTRLGEGNFFGEIGILAEQPRQTTIVAMRETILLRFPRNVVNEMQEAEPTFAQTLLRFMRDRLVMRLTKTSPLFASFAGNDARDLAQRFQFIEVKDFKPLVQQGLRSEGLFILLTGQARVTRTDGDRSSELRILGPGDVFGEMSLVNQEEAIASVVTSSKSFALFLPAKDFLSIIMVHPVVLEYVSTLAKERKEQNEGFTLANDEYIEDQVSIL